MPDVCMVLQGRMNRPSAAETASALAEPSWRSDVQKYIPCSIEGCSGTAHAHKLCSAHDHRLQRYGDPLGTPLIITEEMRFWEKVDKTARCWIWTSTKNKNGYGVFSRGGRAGRMHLAPRVAWEFVNGPIPEGLEIRHKCDNPPCVRIDHLELGTHRENISDAVSRDRQAKGTSFPQASLTEETVKEIRYMYFHGALQRILSLEYGVSRGSISRVVRYQGWKHVP